VRISRSLAQFPRDAHSHGTWGAFGAAVAAAKLWGADAKGLASVIDAVSAFPLLPARSPVTQGGTIHHLNAAIAAQSGVALARAIVAGAEVPAGMLESYYQPTLGGAVTKPVEFSTYEILGNYFKVYPACAHTHTAIQALETILTRTVIRAGDIDRIDVYAFNEAASLDTVHPVNNLAARFSIPHVLARLVVRGGLGLDIWTEDDVAATDIGSVAERVHLHADAKLAAGYPAGRPVRVVVTQRDGTRLEASENTARGEASRPEPEATWRKKLEGLLGTDVADCLLGFRSDDASSWDAASLGRAFSA
jgi:2-methylcitrate dehydratase PrpD